MTNPPRSRRVLLAAVVFEGTLVGVAVLLGWLLNRPSLETIRPTWLGGLQGLVAALPLILVLLWCMKSRWMPLQRLRNEVDQSIAPYFAGASVLMLLLIALLAGLGEELLFRGILLPAMADVTNTGISLILTSIVFGLLHLITPTYALLAAAFGLYLGGLVIATGDIMVPIVTHAGYDVVALGILRHRGLRRQIQSEQEQSAATG